jgi:spore germination protein GerM
MKATQTVILATLAAAGGALLTWLLFTQLPGSGTREPVGAGPAAAAPAEPGRKIKATLFYVAEDGTRLTPVEREVPFGENTAQQARALVDAQLAPVADPLVSAIPPGTTVRALYVTPAGEAYVDLSQELVSAHPGGSMNELLTIYTLVDVLTANLPAVTAVQLLVDGKELETLAGHVDLRRPLTRRTP